MTKILRYIFILTSILWLYGCNTDDDGVDELNNTDTYYSSQRVYSGTWSIDAATLGNAYILADSTTFTITPLPCSSILARLLPDRTIDNVVETDYSAAYDITAATDQAIYFNIRKPALTITANIDGVQRKVDVRVGTGWGLAIGATATYSKLSDVFKLVIPLSGCDIRDVESDELIDTSNETAELTFQTTKRQW